MRRVVVLLALAAVPVAGCGDDKKSDPAPPFQEQKKGPDLMPGGKKAPTPGMSRVQPGASVALLT